MLTNGAVMPLKSTIGGAADDVSVELGHAARSAGSLHEASVVPPTAFVMRPMGPLVPASERLCAQACAVGGEKPHIYCHATAPAFAKYKHVAERVPRACVAPTPLPLLTARAVERFCHGHAG